MKIIVLFMMIYTWSFSNVENEILGEFKEKKSFIQIYKVDESPEKILINYSVNEMYDFLGGEELSGEIVLEVVLIEIFQPNNSIKKTYDLRYSFEVKKIVTLSHPNLVNLVVDVNENFYIDYYKLLDKIDLSGFGGFNDTELIREGR